jgi:chromosome segregation ATPase
MLNSEILDEALVKKNKEIDRLTNQIEDMKRNYDTKIKNLMGSIGTLKNKNSDLENTSKDNIRVSIINKLKEERKDQEQVIELLRRMINDEERVDKFLMKEFDKKGAQRAPPYEELKIKIKQLEAEIISLKYKQISTKPKEKHFSASVDFDETTLQNKISEKVVQYEEQIISLTNENDQLKFSKEKMEKMQNELFEKLKNYNKEIGEMKSIYDVIKKNLQEENDIKTTELTNKLKQVEMENSKFKEKIMEMIKLTEQNSENNLEKMKKLKSENDILMRVLESRKQEINLLNEELNKYKGHFDKLDSRDVAKNKKIEMETEDIKRKKIESEEKVKHLENVVRQKEHQIELLKDTLNDKDEIIIEKDNEIDLLQLKIIELEQIAIENYKKYK